MWAARRVATDRYGKDDPKLGDERFHVKATAFVLIRSGLACCRWIAHSAYSDASFRTPSRKTWKLFDWFFSTSSSLPIDSAHSHFA